MDPRPVEVLSHEVWWPGSLHEWQRIDEAWWGDVEYEITVKLPDARGRPCVIREARRMWQHQQTFRRCRVISPSRSARDQVSSW